MASADNPSAPCDNSPIRVLVTGATGFIASHIIHQLLVLGECQVRGTVRNLESKNKGISSLKELVANPNHSLELVEADLNDPQSWVKAVSGCFYVYHVASPLPSSIPRDESELIVPAVEGTLNVLKACSVVGTVKRVVLTSSLAAISGGLNGTVGYTYTENDWSDATHLPAYEKSKLLAEKAAWNFVERLEEDKKFELVSVHPAVVIGPPLTKASGYSTSLQTVRKLLAGEIPVLLNICLPLVDVRDVAAAQIAAMKSHDAAGKRFIITGENRWLREIAEVMSKEFSNQGYKIPSWTLPKAGVWFLSFFDKTVNMVYPTLGNVMTFSNQKMISELGINPRPVEQTIIDSCYALIENGVVPAHTRIQNKTTE